MTHSPWRPKDSDTTESLIKLLFIWIAISSLFLLLLLLNGEIVDIFGFKCKLCDFSIFVRR